MTSATDRRSVLTGLGALGVMGCSPRTTPEAAAPDQSPAPEAIDFAALEGRSGGRLGFTALDIASGRSLGWRGDERFVYCSTFKMYLAAATLIRIQDGHETLDRSVPVTAADIVSHAPVTQPAVGSSLSVDRL